MKFGLDIGATSAKLGLVDDDGKILTRSRIMIKDYPDIDSFVVKVSELALEMLDGRAVQDVEGIGVGCPNGNYYTGCVENAVNLPWKGTIELSKMMGERMGMKCAITNDANAAALGEMKYGAARGMKNFIELTLGTGVGGGVVVNGELVYGSDGFAGELGHIIVEPNGRMCGCGRKGCLEAYCSATGVARSYEELCPQEKVTSKDVFERAMAGDEIAKKVFSYTGEMLGKAIANLIAVTAPEAVILFGGLTAAGDLLMEPVRQSVETNVLRIWSGGKVRILTSGLKSDDAAILGAAAIV